jgi:hypothetical protein
VSGLSPARNPRGCGSWLGPVGGRLSWIVVYSVGIGLSVSPTPTSAGRSAPSTPSLDSWAVEVALLAGLMLLARVDSARASTCQRNPGARGKATP